MKRQHKVRSYKEALENTKYPEKHVKMKLFLTMEVLSGNLWQMTKKEIYLTKNKKHRKVFTTTKPQNIFTVKRTRISTK